MLAQQHCSFCRYVRTRRRRILCFWGPGTLHQTSGEAIRSLEEIGAPWAPPSWGWSLQARDGSDAIRFMARGRSNDGGSSWSRPRDLLSREATSSRGLAGLGWQVGGFASRRKLTAPESTARYPRGAGRPRPLEAARSMRGERPAAPGKTSRSGRPATAMCVAAMDASAWGVQPVLRRVPEAFALVNTAVLAFSLEMPDSSTPRPSTLSPVQTTAPYRDPRAERLHAVRGSWQLDKSKSILRAALQSPNTHPKFRTLWIRLTVSQDGIPPQRGRRASHHHLSQRLFGAPNLSVVEHSPSEDPPRTHYRRASTQPDVVVARWLTRCCGAGCRGRRADVPGSLSITAICRDHGESFSFHGCVASTMYRPVLWVGGERGRACYPVTSCHISLAVILVLVELSVLLRSFALSMSHLYLASWSGNDCSTT